MTRGHPSYNGWSVTAMLALPLVAALAGAGCGGSDSVSATATRPPQGGVTPTRVDVTTDSPPVQVWDALDPQTCNNDVTAPIVERPIGVSPAINPVGGRPYAVLVWSFCNPGRNDLNGLAGYRMLVSTRAQVVAQSQADPDCRVRADDNAGFPQKCFPPVAPSDLSLNIPMPNLPACKCHAEIVLVNVPPGQEGVVVSRPFTQRTTFPSGTFVIALSSPWDITIEDQEVILR